MKLNVYIVFAFGFDLELYTTTLWSVSIFPTSVYEVQDVWTDMQERFCQKPARDVDELKQCLTVTWSEIQQRVVDHAIDPCRDRLNVCVKAKTIAVNVSCAAP